MKQWFSAAEIAALRLPGLPGSKRSIVRMAEREGWGVRFGMTRRRCNNGGGVEYCLDVLPAAARAAYIARHAAAIEVPAAMARDAAREPGAAGLGGPSAETRDARLALLALAERYAVAQKLRRKAADRAFAALYNAGRIDAADWVRRVIKSITPRTLRRWRAAHRAGNTARLADARGRARRGTGLLARANGGEVKTYILALRAKQPQLTAQHIRALIADRFAGKLDLDGKSLPVPPVRTFQYALKAWENEFATALTALRDPDGFKSRIRFAARIRHPAARLNAIWQIDASPADVLCTDGRHSLYVCEDLYSRRLVALVAKTPRAQAVALVLRKAILAWGVPERVESDNGSDFVAMATRRLLAALAIEHVTVPPFSPEKKGHVERAIGTLQRGLMRTLPGFVGHNVAERKIIEARKSFARRLGETPEDIFAVELSAADLQARVDEWCAIVYGHAPHAGLNGQSPFAAAAQYVGAVRRIADARALDMLLMPAAGKDGRRIVTKSGLRIGGTYYIAGFLTVGAEVHVRMDPADLGRVYVYSADALTYLGEAIAPELAGIDPARAIAAVRAAQKALIEERLGPIRREARRIRAADIAPAIHRQALAAAGKLAEFPKPALPHETPALAAARRAADGNAGAPVHAPEILALAERLRREAEAPNVVALRAEETPHQRWQRARALECARTRGATLSDDDHVWLAGYRAGPEYRGFAKTYGEADDDDNAEEKRA